MGLNKCQEIKQAVNQINQELNLPIMPSVQESSLGKQDPGNCEKGQYWDDDSKQCVNCPTGCSSCSQIKTEQATTVVCGSDCKYGYGFDNAMSVCRLCSSNCSICTYDYHTCTQCSKGSTYDPKSGLCLPCPANCNLCNSSQMCYSCDLFFVNKEGKCVSNNYLFAWFMNVVAAIGISLFLLLAATIVFYWKAKNKSKTNFNKYMNVAIQQTPPVN